MQRSKQPLFLLLTGTLCVLLASGSVVNVLSEETATKPSLTRIISLDLKEQSFANFLRIISETSGMNVVMMQDISLPVTSRLIDLSVEKALDAVITQYDLVKRIDGNVIKVYRKNHLALRKPQETKHYQGRLISLDLQDTDLDNAVRIIEEVASKGVLGKELLPKLAKVTLRLIDVPWDQVLDIVLEQQNLQAVINSDSIRIKDNLSPPLT